MNTQRGVLSSRSSAALAVCATAAWFVTLQASSGMAVGPGTMGRGFIGFLVLWAVMMSAMMLPSVSPVAAMYLRGLRSEPSGAVRGWRTASLVVGYLGAWSAYGMLAYWFARIGGGLAERAPDAAPWVGAGALVVAGVYQLTPLKDVCLAHCRSPVGFLLRFASMSGRLKDVRVGLYHGGFCVGCCWGLMLVLVVVGVMNLGWMVAIAAGVRVEKTWRHGKGFSIAVGVGLVIFAFFVPAHPGLVPGLHPAAM